VFQELLPVVSQTGSGTGTVPEAPTDGQVYGRQGSTTSWVQVLHGIGRNLLHNPLFNVAQRGVGPFSAGYTLDRWQLASSLDTPSITQSPIFDATRSQIGDEAATWALLNTFTGNAGSGAFNLIQQPIENVRRLAGKTVTISLYGWASAALKLGVSVDQFFGAGGSPSAAVTGTGSSVTLSGTAARYSITLSIPSIVGKTLGTAGDCTLLNFWYSSGATNAARAGGVGVQSGTVAIWGVQLEIGSVATPLEKPDPRYDLGNCQRFYSLVHANGRFAATAAGVAGATPVYWPCMRAPPTITLVNSGARNNVSGVTVTTTGVAGGRLNLTSAAAGDSYVLDEYYSVSADL